MSKESYIRGFCKVAAAHGVDPVALAKYAESIMTPEGWRRGAKPPSGIAPEGEIPDVRPVKMDGDPVPYHVEAPHKLDTGNGKALRVPSVRGDAFEFKPHEMFWPKETTTGEPVDPAWLSAHAQSLDEAYKPLREELKNAFFKKWYDRINPFNRWAYANARRTIGDKEQKEINKRYADSMFNITNQLNATQAPVTQQGGAK